MKVLFLTNNDITLPLSNWLKEDAGEVIRRYTKQLSLAVLSSYHPDILISYNYRYIIKKNILDFVDHKAINLHISLLPWNKGAHPNLWSFLDGTPKGVTIHLIDEGIDSGPILLQKELKFDEHKETLFSSYQKLHRVIQEMFMKNWPKIKKFQITSKPQEKGGTTHFKKDFEKISHILGNNFWNQPVSEIKQLLKN